MENHTRLDDKAKLYELDSKQMLRQTFEYDRLCAEGYAEARKLDVPALGDRLRQIVFCSVGGGPVSSLQIARSLLADELKLPVIMHQSHEMPAFVNEHTLVIIANYSGQSEEIVSAYASAQSKGAQIMVLTAGEAFRETAAKNGQLCFTIPGGKIPRIVSVSHVLIPVLVILHRLGLIRDPGPGIEETIDLFGTLKARYSEDSLTESNPAKQLAIDLHGRVPVIYGTDPFTASAAIRFRSQLAENSKRIAISSAMSALHHEDAYGWDADEDTIRSFHFTLIRDKEDSARMIRRIEKTSEVLLERNAELKMIDSVGDSRLARLCSLLYLFDYASLYLAFLYGTNPAWSQTINRFREKYTASS